MPPPWHTKRALKPLLLETLGITEGERERMLQVDRRGAQYFWATAEDPTPLMKEYAEPWYAVACLDCFAEYTKASVSRFANWWNASGRSGVILDVGAGIGASSRYLAELTGAEVICHAFGESPQTRIAHALSVEPLVEPDLAKALVDVAPDAVVAYELLEHLLEPGLFLEAASAARAEVLSVSASWNTIDFGHWATYLFDGRHVPRIDAGRAWAGKCAALGWTRIRETGFWNGRPAIYVREDPPQLSL